MRPLRLQIVVQPRVLPSPAGPASSKEPVIKWLEVCTGDPTIQELCETLEKRFLQRNHTALNIKILKLLDDVELFPDYKIRDIFDDIRDVKQGQKDLSIVNVYRNPPTDLELADPRRYESLPPDSFARPIKRPPSPYLRRPPPPLFADAKSNGVDKIFQGPDSQFNEFENRSQTPNKRRKLQGYGSGAYINDRDRAIDSREGVDHGYVSSQSAYQHPSQEPQVKDSQTSARNKHPYGTPISSQIGLYENGKMREAGMVSVPDSPPNRMTVCDNDSRRSSSVHSDSGSRSPELPSTLGRLSQLPEASTKVRSTELQTRPSHEKLAESETKPAARTSINRVEVSSLGKPDFLSQIEEAQRGAELPISPSDVPNKDSTTPKIDDARALPLVGRQFGLGPESHVESGSAGRLKRPNVLKSARALQGAPRLINGVRQKAPSITDVFDPIETSEGSSYERQLPRSLKRAKTTMPKKNLRETTLQKAAGKDSLIVRLSLPNVSQPEPTPVTLREGSAYRIQDANGVASRASTQDSESAASDSQDQNSSVERPPVTTTVVPTFPNSNLGNAKATTNGQAQPFKGPANLQSQSASPELADQGKSIASSVQPGEDLHDGHTVGDANSSQALDKEIGDETLVRQAKEAQEVSEKAQAEFDRITALQKKRQSLQEPKAIPAVAESPSKLAVFTQPASSTLSLSHEARGSHSSDDLEAKRRHGLEQLASTRDKYFSATAAPNSSNDRGTSESQAYVKPKKTEVRAEAKAETKRKRQVKEQKDKEVRMRIADKLEKEGGRAEGSDDMMAVRTRNEKMRSASKQQMKDVETPRRKVDTVDEVMEIPSTSEDRSGPETPKKPQGSPRTAGSARVELTAEATKAEHGAGRSTGPIEQAIRDSSRNTLAERSPKARLNAQRQLQIANHALKYSNKDLEKSKAPATKDKSKVTKAPIRASKGQHRPSAEQAAKKTRGETQEPASQRRSKSQTSTVYVDDAALTLARAAGMKSASTASNVSNKPSLGTTKATAVDLAASESIRSSKEPSRRSSSSARNEPSRARTMTPAIPNSYLQNPPDSAEARARRAASVNANNLETPTRTTLPGKATASRRSVSFAEESVVSQSHGRKSVDHQSTPTPSDHTSRMSKLGKTPEKTKQATMTKHVDRKLKGKVVDPPSPIGAPTAKEIVISSESEASTFFSDESEGERSARAGPSSRKKPKARDSSSISTSALPISKPEATLPTTTKPNIQPAGQGPTDASRHESSRPIKATDTRVVSRTNLKTKPSSSQSAGESESRTSRSTSAESTDDISNLPPIREVKQARPKSPARSNSKLLHKTPTPQTQSVDASALRKKDEERRQLEADEQLQREYSQAMEAKTTTDKGSSEDDDFQRADEPPRQTTQRAVRSGHDKYGSRVRINPTYENLSLSQLVKAQAAEPRALNGSTKKMASAKSDGQPSVDSSSASDSEESSSSASVDLSRKAQGGATSQKKGVLPSVWRDLYGREASGRNYQ
ncbi:MAG: hypothetical protein Q9169_004480 [Polycauliona sp. 2 TL-2023]